MVSKIGGFPKYTASIEKEKKKANEKKCTSQTHFRTICERIVFIFKIFKTNKFCNKLILNYLRFVSLQAWGVA